MGTARGGAAGELVAAQSRTVNRGVARYSLLRAASTVGASLTGTGDRRNRSGGACSARRTLKDRPSLSPPFGLGLLKPRAEDGVLTRDDPQGSPAAPI